MERQSHLTLFIILNLSRHILEMVFELVLTLILCIKTAPHQLQSEHSGSFI